MERLSDIDMGNTETHAGFGGQGFLLRMTHNASTWTSDEVRF